MDVVLVAMPWSLLASPSIQLGTVEAIVARTGRSVRSYSAFLAFGEWATQVLGDDDAFTLADHSIFAEDSFVNGIGDWVFAVPPFRQPTPDGDAAYLAFLAPVERPRTRALAQRLRDHIDTFLDACVAEILRDDPAIVGFTTTFSQTVASLNVAARIKAQRPATTIVFGGANCDGAMGAALHAAAGVIDYVVRGEAEYALPLLLDALTGNGSLANVPGLVYFDAAGTSIANPAPQTAAVRMHDVPMPVYDEYFARLARSPLRAVLNDAVALPIESARGCWWGEKHHCTFCGLNGSAMAFRSKDPAVVQAEVIALSTRYRRTRFSAVDNIIDLRYFTTFLPWLKTTRASGYDWDFFYETKANLRKEQLALFRDAGVKRIQPGIESLHTEVLRLMDKGVTGLQNIRLMKWAREYGIALSWNLLYGFPGERPDYYEHIYDLIPSLTHLEAPGLAQILLERFSPYFDAPERYGIALDGAAGYYRMIYPYEPRTLDAIASVYEHHVDSLEPNPWIAKIAERLNAMWKRGRANAESTLTFTRGIDHIAIRDRRSGSEPHDLTLSGSAAAIYLACDAGATIDQLAAGVARTSARGAIVRLLDDLVGRRLLYAEGGIYLALAVAERPLLAAERAPIAEGAGRDARRVTA